MWKKQILRSEITKKKLKWQKFTKIFNFCSLLICQLVSIFFTSHIKAKQIKKIDIRREKKLKFFVNFANFCHCFRFQGRKFRFLTKLYFSWEKWKLRFFFAFCGRIFYKNFDIFIESTAQVKKTKKWKKWCFLHSHRRLGRGGVTMKHYVT